MSNMQTRHKEGHPVIYLLLACLFTLNLLLPPLPAKAQTGKEVIESLVRIFANLKGDDSNFDRTQLAEAAHYIDYRGMAERALGNKDWNKLTKLQKQIYLQSFKSLIERRYYGRWHKIFAHSQIVYRDEERNAGDVIVKTTMTTGKSAKDVVWTLAGEQAKVIDLTVEDHDILKRVHARFQRKIDGAGVPAFIAWLQKRSKETFEEEETNLSAER